MKSLTIIGIKLFPADEDKLWKKWVNFKDRNEKDLVALLIADVKDGFKKRALFLLLVPDANFNPVYWKGKVGKFYANFSFLKSLSPELLTYVADLVVDLHNLIKPLHEQFPDAHQAYNKCILGLLTLLPEAQGEKIFPLFSLRDFTAYQSPDDASGYGPFHGLLITEGLNKKWKLKADMNMRKIIKNELSGKSQPREKWEDALSCYASIVQMQLSGKLGYPRWLLLYQLIFIIDSGGLEKGLINGWNFADILNVLSDDKRKDLRIKIAKFVGSEKSGFTVYNKETLSAANMILKEFGSENPGLADWLKLLISNHNAEEITSINQKIKETAAEDALMAQMK